jgi:predicted dehydrogenase
MVGYMKRYAVTFKKAKVLLEEGTIGELISFNAYAYSSDFFGVRERRKFARSRGGVARDLGAHVIDLAVWYFGDLNVTSASSESEEGTVHATVKTRKDQKGFFEMSWCLDSYRMPEFGLKIQGTRGILKVSDDELKIELHEGQNITFHRHDLLDNVPFLCGGPEYFREDEHFVKSILEGKNAAPNFKAASKIDYVLDQIECQAHLH